jgi:hypothetical protein
MIDPTLSQFLAANGYTDLHEIDGVVYGLQKFMFTHGLMVGLTMDSYERRYCYEHRTDALAALESWDGEGHPSGPWIKCKGRGIDMLNPNLESIHD